MNFLPDLLDSIKNGTKLIVDQVIIQKDDKKDALRNIQIIKCPAISSIFEDGIKIFEIK